MGRLGGRLRFLAPRAPHFVYHPRMDPKGLFQQCVEIDPAAPDRLQTQLAAVPDKPAVYLLAAEDDQAVLLASGLAVRSILRRRLGEPIQTEPPEQSPEAESERAQGAPGSDRLQRPVTAFTERVRTDATRPRSRRADLRPIIRRLYLRPTCSPFETDLWYLWLARGLFADRYRRMIRRRSCWMIHGDPSEQAPRLVVTDRFTPETGRRIGPVRDRRSAVQLVELLTAVFGLCHHYQSPRRGASDRACEYREMGRCTGVCEGTVSLDEYRGQVSAALEFSADAGRTWRTGQTARMHAVARALDFEQAGRIKRLLDRAADLDRPHYDWLGDAERLDVLIVQPGPRKAQLRTFRGFAGRLAVGPDLTRASPAEGLDAWLRMPPPQPDAIVQAEEAGLLADYLFRGQRDRGLFVRFTGQSAAELAERVKAVFPPTGRRNGQRTGN